MITILSIDGGGIRGLIPAVILAEIERRTGKPVCALFDYIAGTSTGGVIAAMLTIPDARGRPKYTAEKVKSLYEELGRSVFHSSLLRKIFTAGGLLRPRYSSKRLCRHLDDYLGSARLHSALTEILITAYETQSGTPWFFKSRFAAVHRSNEDDPLLSQVAFATSAAPTYFPPCKIGERLCFIDGGIFAGNPAMCAYAEARRRNPQETSFLVVSLGTGKQLDRHPFRQIRNWGALRWAIPIFDVFSNSARDTVDYQMKTFEGSDRYFRFDIRLDDDAPGMDDASRRNIRELETLARMEIRHDAARIDRLCRLLMTK